MAKQAIENRIKEISAEVASANGLELVHAEVVGAVKNRTVRIFIDKPEGVTHEDCALVSNQVGEILDVEDFIPDAFVLEVSSPGLERGLYSVADFDKFAGSLAQFKTYQAINGQKNFTGRITGVENETVIFDDNTNGEVKVPFASISKANLQVDLEEEFKRAKVKD